MKRRNIEPDTAPEGKVENLAKALLALERLPDMRAFLLDLCTPAELEALTDRWQVVPLLLEGVPYRDIHEQTAVSITTIGRVARFLNDGNGGYQKAMAATTARRGPVSAGRRKA